MSSNYSIEFSSSAKKQLKRLDKPTVRRIVKDIETLIESPYNHSRSKKMKGYEGNVYRLRVGSFRVLYEIIEDQIMIFIFKIGPRGDVYKK